MTELKTEITNAIAQNPEMTNKEIAAQVGCSNTYPYLVKKQYPQQIVNQALKHDTDLNKLDDRILDNATLPKDTESTDETELWKKVVEYIARHPDATNREVAEEVGCSISYPSDVRDAHHDKITTRIDEYGTSLSEWEKSTQRRQKKRAQTWGGLSDRQQNILMRLAEEPDPETPDTPLRKMAEDADTEDPPCPSLISDVNRKYGEFAVLLKEVGQLVDENQDPEKILHSKNVQEVRGWVEKAKQTPTRSEEVTDKGTTINEMETNIEQQRRLTEAELEYSDSDLAKIRLDMIDELQSKLSELAG